MSMIPLPSWVDAEAWAGFCEMRRKMPKSRPFTDRAAVLILKELQRIKDAGHCPNAALDQSTLRGWADVWPLKDKEIQRASSNTGRELAAMKAHDEALRVNPVDAGKVRDMLSVVKTNLTKRA
jgi:hypothetical protein